MDCVRDPERECVDAHVVVLDGLASPLDERQPHRDGVDPKMVVGPCLASGLGLWMWHPA
jgi:hypothetical protein